MATQLQQDLAEAIVANAKLPRAKRKNKGELVKSVGYSAKVADRKSTEIIEAKGVKKTLQDWGLTEELITTALVEDIKGKPLKRYSELTLAAEILGMKKQEHGNTTNILNIIAPEQAERIARRVLDGDTEGEAALNRLPDSNQPEV